MAPRVLAACSRCVFKSFKRFERWGERLIGHIGPYFVGLAVILISGCAFTYFDVVYRHRFLAPTTSLLSLVLGTLWSFYLIWMFSFNYYKAITIPAGSPLDPPRAAPDRRAWAALVPSAICVGPLKGLATKGKDDRSDRRRAKVVRDIAAAHERRLAESMGAGGLPPSPRGSGNGNGTGEVDAVERDGRPRRQERVCRKCVEGPSGPPPKPERTHHCSVCRRCTLKFDHHCPWISGCVGLHNERYFLLFLCYFSIACGTAAIWGWVPVTESFRFGTGTWPYYSPRIAVLLLWVLSLVMCFAVGIMGIFQLWLVALGETAVESHDNDWYRKTAVTRGRKFRNPYDFGRRQNLVEFFNIGPSGYHWSTIFLPIEIPPASDGWTYKKADGWEEFAMDYDDELTDEEEMSEDE